jgi:hypothetical protein
VGRERKPFERAAFEPDLRKLEPLNPADQRYVCSWDLASDSPDRTVATLWRYCSTSKTWFLVDPFYYTGGREKS